MTVYFLRQGECNRCGQCCGAPGTGQPDRRTPYARTWPETLSKGSLDDIVAGIPQLGLCGLGLIGEDTIGLPDGPVGEVKIQGKRFYYVWVPGEGLSRDTSPQHDGSQWEPECPFLEPGLVGTTPPPGEPMACGLIGTNEDGAYRKWCQQEPRARLSQELKEEWEWRYPDCSYTWIEDTG